MDPSSALDRNAVRRQFARRVERLAHADYLAREVERRMLDKLEVVKLAPSLVIDVGSGLGHGAARLQQRFPGATVIGVDVAAPLAARAAQLHGARARNGLANRLRGWFGGGAAGDASPPAFCAAHAARLPLRPSSVDLVWSNLAWNWFDDPLAALDEWYRVIRPDGLLMFSAFGVDTLRELRAAGARLQSFPDMHDLGDALSQSGFADPVMDAERLQVTWSNAQTLIDEVRALGGNALRDRARGLSGRGRRARWVDAVSALAGPDGRIAVTFELVFGHAWCPPRKRLADGYAPLVFAPRRARDAGSKPSE